MRRKPLEERGRWRQGQAEGMGTGDEVVNRGSKDVGKEKSWCVGFGVVSLDEAVDEQRSWIADVVDAVDQGLAGQAGRYASSTEQTN